MEGMNPLPSHSGSSAVSKSSPRRPVVYAGRVKDDPLVASTGGAQVLDDWSVLPWDLHDALDGAAALVILDPLSFPFDGLPPVHWELPMVVRVPAELDSSTVSSLLDTSVLGHLTFFDRIAIDDDTGWQTLRHRHGWSESQRLSATPGGLEAYLDSLTWVDDTAGLDGAAYETHTYWRQRGELAQRVPAQAVCSIRHDLRTNKSMHLIQAAALIPEFEAARRARPSGSVLQVVELGCGVGRWAASFKPGVTQFTGLDISEAMVAAAASNFPEREFRVVDDDLDLGLENETVDLAYTVTVLHHNPPRSRARLLRQMWRALRPGGRLVFLEDFVRPAHGPASTVYPMPIRRFVAELIDATRGGVVLEQVHSLRYPYDDFHRAAVVAVSKIGVPKRW